MLPYSHWGYFEDVFGSDSNQTKYTALYLIAHSKRITHSMGKRPISKRITIEKE